MKRRRLLIALTSIAAVAVGLLVGTKPFLLWWLHTRPFSAEEFDQARWVAGLKASQNGECVRGRMADDIIAEVAVPGRAKREIDALLGPPQRMQGDVADYELGMCSGFGIDFDSLYVEYSNGKAVRAYHVQH